MPDSPAEHLGRNEPCHCGSGKKYKRCHLAADAEAQREEQAQTLEEAPASTPDERSAAPPERPQRPTEQPWKRGGQGRSFQRFQTPPKRGGG